MGWEGMSNGDLIAAAEANAFDVIITADQNLRYQQSIADRKIAIVVLSTNHWATISRDPARVVEAVGRCTPGSFIEIGFERPAPRPRGQGPRFGR
jgi:hypothetical protein